MARGIFRTDDDWVQVDYGKHTAPVPRDRYEQNGYEPPFEKLPTEDAYRAAQGRK